jgi:probable HAF family extracellular repeat protein
MQDLGTLGGRWARAIAISADGSIIVGESHNAANQYRAFRWTLTGGMEDLNQSYACLLTDGSVLQEADALSPDGRYIAGRGFNATTGRYEAFLLDTSCTPHNGDVNLDGAVDDVDLLHILFAFGNTGNCLGRTDVDCNGEVDETDLLTVLFNFGSGG